MKKSAIAIGTAFFCIPILLPAGAAEAGSRYPDGQINGVEWFYVFGPDGNPLYGAEREPEEFFVELPEGAGGPISLWIIDADTRKEPDERDGIEWNTDVRFSVYRGDELLDSRTVSSDESDGTLVEMGPFEADRLRIVAEGMRGNDNNLFAFEIEPPEAQLFSYSPSIRLAQTQGARMRFYPEIPAGVTVIRVGNHDLDPGGGTAAILPPTAGEGALSGKALPLRNSDSAQWAWTDVPVPPEAAGSRWTYQLTKETQPRANASLRVEDSQGQPLPIYFRPGQPLPAPVPVSPCKTFLFDASKSYDPDNQALTYQWEFGDGTTAAGIRTQHTYAEAGDYQAVLTVTDNSTAACRQSTVKQWVHPNTAPIAVLRGPAQACAGSTVRFSAAESLDSPGDRLSYRWDLGDGTTAEGGQVSHAYARGGAYPVKVVVDDNRQTSCSTAQAFSTLRVNSPPIAAGPGPITLCTRNPEQPLTIAFDARSSEDPDGDALMVRWDFGDGQQGEGARVSHTYEKGGRYTAKLLVDDGSGTDCSTAAANIPVTLNRAPVAPFFRDVTACEGEALSFDASGFTDPDGNALTFRWDFGDGAGATGAKVDHPYAQGGTYQGSLSIDDGTGMDCAVSSGNFTIRVNSPPVAAFQTSHRLGCVGEAFEFDGATSSDAGGRGLNYQWNFGDGTTAEGAKVRHAYAKGGAYPVTLKVDDGEGTSCSSAVARAQMQVNTPPVADAGPNLVCCQGETVAFDASRSMDADGDALTYAWDFGDGNTSQGARVQHAYMKNGTYPVRVAVSDGVAGACGTATSGFTAVVNAPPVAQMEISGEGKTVSVSAADQTAEKVPARLPREEPVPVSSMPMDVAPATE